MLNVSLNERETRAERTKERLPLGVHTCYVIRIVATSQRSCLKSQTVSVAIDGHVQSISTKCYVRYWAPWCALDKWNCIGHLTPATKTRRVDISGTNSLATRYQER